MSLAGGGTDLEPFILEYGGSIIATTIDLHVETTVQSISESGITIESVDQGLNLYLSKGVPDENLLILHAGNGNPKRAVAKCIS